MLHQVAWPLAELMLDGNLRFNVSPWSGMMWAVVLLLILCVSWLCATNGMLRTGWTIRVFFYCYQYLWHGRPLGLALDPRAPLSLPSKAALSFCFAQIISF